MIAEKHEPIDNQEEDFFDSDELMDEPVYGPVVELVDEYVHEVKRYNRLLNLEEFLKFVLTTSIFDDGKIVWDIDDHISFVLKLERS